MLTQNQKIYFEVEILWKYRIKKSENRRHIKNKTKSENRRHIWNITKSENRRHIWNITKSENRRQFY